MTIRLSMLSVTAVLCGCTISLPFNQHLGPAELTEARQLNAHDKGPISISWDPASFPDRVDSLPASGYIGSTSKTVVPTGVGLATRITEALDAAVGVDPSSPQKLKIRVIDARTSFEYSGGITLKATLDVAACELRAELSLGDQSWKDVFQSSQKETAGGPNSQTGVLEAAWDDVAIQVARSVVKHLK
jgi:hypothetical protein